MTWKKWLYIILLVVIIVPILFFYQAFNGNPVSKFASKKSLENFLAEKYPEHEYRIHEGVYNFKISGYSFDVNEIGDPEQTTYQFEVTGFLKPKVTLDAIYLGNLDEPLINKLSEEASEELTEVLSEKVPSIMNTYVHIEVSKGKYKENTNWSKDLQLENPISINITVDVTNMTKGDVLEAAKAIQQTLRENNYVYDEVGFNGNMFDENIDDKEKRDYLKYWITFDEDSNLTINDVKELDQ